MLKKKFKILFILGGVLFFLTALTLYINKIVLPVQIKNLAITQAEKFLNRKVEIESIRFNWLKGFIIERVKIYQKDSPQVFVQAERISAGLLFIPGRPAQITLPFINIQNFSAHLIRTGMDEWNFSDLLTPPPAQDGDKPAAFKFSATALHIMDGKIRLDDLTRAEPWTELVDNINIDAGLSLKGIAFKLNAAILAKQGLVDIQGSYNPLDQSLDAQTHITNVKPSDYLTFVPAIIGLSIKDGLIEDIAAHIQYSPVQTHINGSFKIKNLDAAYNEHAIQGSLAARNADFKIANGSISLNGDFQADQARLNSGTIKASGNIMANIAQCDIEKGKLLIDGSFYAKDSSLAFAPDQSITGDLSLEKIKARQDADGIQLVGAVITKNFDVHWQKQHFHGDVTLKPTTIEMKDMNDLRLSGDLSASDVMVRISETQYFKGQVELENIKAQISDQKNITWSSKTAINQMNLHLAQDQEITGSIDLPRLSITLKDGTLDVDTEGDLNNWQVDIDKDKNIVAESSFSLTASAPLEAIDQATYKGTFTVHNAVLDGYPLGPFNEIQIKSDFITNQLNVRTFSLVAMETALKGSATVMNFKNPVLNLGLASDKFDLSKLSTVLPDIFKEYGLTTSGEASFNLQFEGLASDPLSGRITSKASLNNAQVSSTKFNQELKNISGNIEGSPERMTWDKFTADYQGKIYTLSGSLLDYKNPIIKTTIKGDDLDVVVDLAKTNDVVSIKEAKGIFAGMSFATKGRVVLTAEGPDIDLDSSADFDFKAITPFIPADQMKIIEPYNIDGKMNIAGQVKGKVSDWKNWTSMITLKSPKLTAAGYTLSDIALQVTQHDGKITNATLDALAYEGKIHVVASSEVNKELMPFEIALNIDGLNMNTLKNDIPQIKSEELNGRFYTTAVASGKMLDLANMTGKGSMAIREGFLTEFKFFKGILSILNKALKLGQVMITDVDGNFVIENQKVTTDNLRLRSPTIVLLTQGWVDFKQDCDLNVTVDMTSGIIPSVAEELLRTLQIHIYDQITNPKFTQKISVPQVINSIIKTIGIFQ